MDQGTLSWIVENWVPLGLAAFIFLEKIVKLSPTKWDDLLIDGLRAIFRKGGAKTVLVVPVLGLLMLSACATVDYVPPEACNCTGNLEECDSRILGVVPDANGADLVLQLANLSALEAGAYTKEDALEVISEIEAFLAASETWATLVSYVAAKLSYANAAAGMIIFAQSGYLQALNVQEVISPCDIAILNRHLGKQKAVINAFVEPD